jgi:hypothetical protein
MVYLSTRDKLFVLMFIISTIFNITLLYNNFKRKLIISSQEENIKILLRQSARYSIAALQDENKAIAILHANYGAAYLYALTDVYTENIIEELAGINIQQFKKEVQSVQDQVTKGVYEACPNIVPKNSSKILLFVSQGL